MTPTDKPVRRVTKDAHPRHQRQIVVSIGPGDVVGFRLSRSSKTYALPVPMLFDLAERKHAEALAGFNAGPCSSPKRFRNV